MLFCGTQSNCTSLSSSIAFIVLNGTQFLPALCLLLLTVRFFSFALCICVFLSSVFQAPELLSQLVAFSTNYGHQLVAGPSVPAGRILFLNIILSPVPKQYLSRSRYSINVNANNDQFSLRTQKANFSISLGFLCLIQTLSFLLTSDSLDFRLHICTLNTDSLFYVCTFFQTTLR